MNGSATASLLEASQEIDREAGDRLSATAPSAGSDSRQATSALAAVVAEMGDDDDGYGEESFEASSPRRSAPRRARSPTPTRGETRSIMAAAAEVANDPERAVTADVLAETARETSTADILAETAREVQGSTADVLAETAREVQGSTADILAETAREVQGSTADILAETAREVERERCTSPLPGERRGKGKGKGGRRVRISGGAVDLVRQSASRKMLEVMTPEQARLFQAHWRLKTPGDEAKREAPRRRRQQRQPVEAWAERLSEPKRAPPSMAESTPEAQAWLRTSVQCSCPESRRAACSVRAPHPRCARAKKGYAKASDARNCTFMPKTKKRPGAEEKDESKDNFINRMDAAERGRRQMLETRRGEAQYKLRQDKKVCPTCGVEQSYNEVVSKQKRCGMCGVEYRPRKAWASVSKSFWRRLEEHEEQKAERRERLAKEVTPEFRLKERAELADDGSVRTVSLQRKSYTDAEWSGFLDRMETDRRRRDEKILARQSMSSGDFDSECTFTPRLTQSTHQRYQFKPFMERMQDDVMRRTVKQQEMEWSSMRNSTLGGAERKDDFERLVLSAKSGYDF